MTSYKRWKLKKFFTSKFGCGCGTKTVDVCEPMLNSTTFPDPKPRHSTSSNDDEYCPGNQCSSYCSGRISPCLKIRDSFAVEKYSEDPCHDFCQSMIQMISKKELYSRDDLQQLLGCFLELNSPQHHGVIVRTFTEIWNGGILRSSEI